ncbi:isoprenyl transferase [Anaerofustis stercorihominis]|uniref:Isoprenyl transferase n=4 Tax=Anaerofustis stercorihominis TaxID=214853 RepID=B1C6C6_9FIRM|nr:isoprenyl transferase [Anaerofustis stercorihominis]EDS73411.1 di-trans,poly-cis-decaprenylcistransferase [Anaerofustis stercorihominis DSM 17244]MCQ4794933.1 isoprenyl transferase [Anaerofustis stercorihominis]RGD73349.1 isoprenyl transferase [Anaerofustis stercorihominis]
MNNIKLDKDNMPEHLAIIMDGNGRWAKQKGKIRSFGHKFGAKTVKDIIRAVNDLNIKHLTLYAFSTENWKRPKDEVTTIMNLVVEYLNKETDDLIKENVKMDFIGDIGSMPEKTRISMNDTIERTKNGSGLNVHIALNYGGRKEIVNAAKEIIKEGIDACDLDEELFSKYLYNSDNTEVDLLIRTGGDIRISNFLLWQVAYSELYFCDTLWPDFTKEELHKAIYSFQHKERRFGGLVK